MANQAVDWRCGNLRVAVFGSSGRCGVSSAPAGARLTPPAGRWRRVPEPARRRRGDGSDRSSIMGPRMDGPRMMKIFVGYDPRESIAFSVLSHSLYRRSSVAAHGWRRLMLPQLADVLPRPRDPHQSTAFAISPFPGSAPFPITRDGRSTWTRTCWARADPAALWALRDDRYAIMVVKHAPRAGRDDEVPRGGAARLSPEELGLR